MANFTASQSISVQGLCATIKSTDNSDYSANTEGITAANVVKKIWVFRDGNGNIIKQLETDGTVYECSCAISLLTFNISITLFVQIQKDTFNQNYSVQNNFLIACLPIL